MSHLEKTLCPKGHAPKPGRGTGNGPADERVRPSHASSHGGSGARGARLEREEPRTKSKNEQSKAVVAETAKPADDPTAMTIPKPMVRPGKATASGRSLWEPGDPINKTGSTPAKSYLTAASKPAEPKPAPALVKASREETTSSSKTVPSTSSKKRKPTSTLEFDLLTLALKNRKADEKRRQATQQVKPKVTVKGPVIAKIGKVKGAGAIARRKNRLSSLKKRILQERKLMLWLLKPETKPFPLQSHPALIDYQCVWLPKRLFDRPQSVQTDRLDTRHAEEERVSTDTSEEESMEDVESSAEDGSEHFIDSDDEEGSRDEGNNETDTDEEASDDIAHGDPKKVLSPSEAVMEESNTGNLKSTKQDDEIGTVPFDPNIASPVFFGCFYRRRTTNNQNKLDEAETKGTLDRSQIPALPLARPIREYVNQALSPELDEMCLETLRLLYKYQERARSEDPVNAKLRRRLVMGMHEVRRGVRSNRCIAVLVAPNLEDAAGVDEKLEEILRLCREEPKVAGSLWKHTPVIFTSNRKQIGRTLGKRGMISCVGIYSADGAHEQFKRSLRLAEQMSAFYQNQLLSEQKVAGLGKRLFCETCLSTPLDTGYVRKVCFRCSRSYCELCASKKLNPQNQDWCSASEGESAALCHVVKIGRIPPKVVRKTLSVQAKEFVPPSSTNQTYLETND